jgi:tryptophan halogenase
MHICIIGTGSSGWISCNTLKNLNCIDKITIIGSPNIPPIGVGESNTLSFLDFLNDLIENKEFTIDEFITNTDAAIKYGVYYENWSKRDYIHHFKGGNPDEIEYEKFTRLLANKDPEIYIHDFLDSYLIRNIFNNKLVLDTDRYPISYHFDAGKFIEFFSKIALKNPKVNFISGTVTGGKKNCDLIQNIIVDGTEISADYYIFATGDSKINKDFLEVNYEDLSNVLLTNKAVVCPLKYTNKREQFHPYTKAKTMKYGWRWITPTWSRIGTGYVFSTNYISIDEAIDEFLDDIGDKTLEPMIVNFEPKYNKTPFHQNYCTLGMSQGFLEPLDAPGLSITINTISHIARYLENTFSDINKMNKYLNREFKFWTSFILSQYKTCYRDDTQFWRDHNLIKYDHYDMILNMLDDDGGGYKFQRPFEDIIMFRQTLASKDIRWKTSLTDPLFKIKEKKHSTINHFDYIQNINNRI